MSKLKANQTIIPSEDITLTGTWRAITQTTGDNSIKVATTAYVDNEVIGERANYLRYR